MSNQILQKVESKFIKSVPDIRPGYTVKVHQKIKEGEKERIQIFEGLVINVRGDKGVSKTFTVRRILSGVGVEKIFPLHSKSIDKIEVVKTAKVSRAKLFFMRHRSGKSARLKESYLLEGIGMMSEVEAPEVAVAEVEAQTEEVTPTEQATETTPEEEVAPEEVVEQPTEEVVEEAEKA